VKELQMAAVVRNEAAAVQELFQKHVVPTYSRFDLVFSHGQGSYLFDVRGKRYLDMGAGIAVCVLGHAHLELADALSAQARKLVHVSNLYYHEQQGRLAANLDPRIGPGKCFFCNSGAEANEALFKLARRFGHEEGRFEILTAHQSFHGRTLAGIAATGQDKVKKGFGPPVPGFRHIPFNDLEAARAAISPATVAILIEGIQGEGGITAARADYLLGLRQLCDAQKLLLLIDGVQCGYFRTGRFQSFQRILENASRPFLPDGLAMAKSIGGGFPMGAVWVREPFADLLGAGSHGTTYGGTPLACAVALKVLEIIDRDGLADHARRLGDELRQGLDALAAEFPQFISSVRGLGLMLGIELVPDHPALSNPQRPPSLEFVNRLHEKGLLTVPSGNQVIRLLPPLNLSRTEAAEALQIMRSLLSTMVS
jgi:acetylornithine aminotransferase/acetylornithine/N-succinyldiaminopimelate aminotransferase